MRNQEIALAYVRYFCTGDIDGIESLLDPDLKFSGPLLQCDSAEAYLAGLRADPPEPCEYTVLNITTNEDSVALFYTYRKTGQDLTLAQLFTFRNGKIRETKLVFDTGVIPG